MVSAFRFRFRLLPHADHAEVDGRRVADLQQGPENPHIGEVVQVNRRRAFVHADEAAARGFPVQRDRRRDRGREKDG